MLVIRPTDDGRLHLSNNQRHDVVSSESAARSTAHRWGHTDLVINKALADMRAAGGGVTPELGWRVLRPDAPVAEVATRPARRASREVAAPSHVAEEPTQPKPKRSRARLSAPKAEEATPQETEPEADIPSPAPPAQERPKRRSRKAPEVVTAAPEQPAPKVVEPATPAATEPKPAGASRRSRKQEQAPQGETAPVVAAPVAEGARVPAKPAPTRRKRAAAPPVAEPETTVAAGSRRERAQAVADALARELSGIETEVLPFARGPWTDLREMAEFVAACLRGGKPKTAWRRGGSEA